MVVRYKKRLFKRVSVLPKKYAFFADMYVKFSPFKEGIQRMSDHNEHEKG